MPVPGGTPRAWHGVDACFDARRAVEKLSVLPRKCGISTGPREFFSEMSVSLAAESIRPRRSQTASTLPRPMRCDEPDGEN
jgi:hypothetical protein